MTNTAELRHRLTHKRSVNRIWLCSRLVGSVCIRCVRANLVSRDQRECINPIQDTTKTTTKTTTNQLTAFRFPLFRQKEKTYRHSVSNRIIVFHRLSLFAYRTSTRYGQSKARVTPTTRPKTYDDSIRLHGAASCCCYCRWRTMRRCCWRWNGRPNPIPGRQPESNTSPERQQMRTWSGSLWTGGGWQVVRAGMCVVTASRRGLSLYLERPALAETASYLMTSLGYLREP